MVLLNLIVFYGCHQSDRKTLCCSHYYRTAVVVISFNVDSFFTLDGSLENDSKSVWANLGTHLRAVQRSSPASRIILVGVHDEVT